MLARALAFSSSSCCALIYCSKKFVASFFPTLATIGLAAGARIGLEAEAVTGVCFATGGSIFVIGLTVVAGFGGIGFGAGAVVKTVYYCYCSNGF